MNAQKDWGELKLVQTHRIRKTDIEKEVRLISRGMARAGYPLPKASSKKLRRFVEIREQFLAGSHQKGK